MNNAERAVVLNKAMATLKELIELEKKHHALLEKMLLGLQQEYKKVR